MTPGFKIVLRLVPPPIPLRFHHVHFRRARCILRCRPQHETARRPIFHDVEHRKSVPLQCGGSKGFLYPNPDEPRASTKLFPSFKSLCLIDFILDGNDWSHSTTYLAHQASGGQAVLFEVCGRFPHLCPEAVKEVGDLAEAFYRCPNVVTVCPLGRCGRGMKDSGR